ncbi:MAG: hypothetical protein WDN26_18590 [Chitinophagaceae bacterium]
MKTLLFSPVLSIFMLAFFSGQKDMNCGHSGIKGQVYVISGNQMPSPDAPPPAPKGMKTTLYVYELTNTSQVSRNGSSAFYKDVSTKLVKELATKEDGSFSIKLKPGTYSLFVKKGDLFYSNLFDGQNNIHPVEVKKGKMTEEKFRVDYEAVY